MLKEQMNNGKVSLRDENETTKSAHKLCTKKTMALMPPVFNPDLETDLTMEFPTTFWQQFWILLKRKLLQQIRGRVSEVIWSRPIYLLLICTYLVLFGFLQTALSLLLFQHLVSGVLTGTMFFGLGDNAVRFLDNFKFLLCVMVFFMYTYLMVPVLLCKYYVQN